MKFVDQPKGKKDKQSLDCKQRKKMKIIGWLQEKINVKFTN